MAEKKDDELDKPSTQPEGAESVVSAPPALEQTQWDFHTSLFERGRTHEKISLALRPAYFVPLSAALSDYLSFEQGRQNLEAKDVIALIDANFDAANLDEQQAENILKRIELFRLIRGQTGREIRRELNGFEKFQEHALPDMVAPAYLAERDRVLGFLEAITQGKTRALNIAEPLNEQLEALLKNPETLYERVLMEHNMVALKAAHSAGKNEAKAHLPKFVRDKVPIPYSLDPLATISERKQKIEKEGPITKPVDKWLKLVPQLFTHEPKLLGTAVLDTVGFIPDEIYTKKDFKKRTFTEVANFHNEVLRAAQERKDGICGVGKEFNVQRILHARTQCLRHMFLSGIAETVKNPDAKPPQIVIDVNGAWINITDPNGGKNAAQLHAHIPFAYVDDELLDYMEQNTWLSKLDILEIRLQRAKANNNLLEEQELEARKAFEFNVLCDRRQRASFTFENFMETVPYEEARRPNCPSLECAEICCLLASRLTIVPQAVVHHGGRIPESVIRYYLREFQVHKYPRSLERMMDLLKIAEIIQSAISEEVELETDKWRFPQQGYPYQPHEKMSHRKTHKLNETAKATYKIRQRILNDPRSYDVARILAAVIEEGIPNNSATKEFLVFRGDYGENNGHQHQFLEIVHEGSIVRVLISPDKHLNKRQRDLFSTIPELTRQDYEELEAFAMIHNHLNKQLKEIEFINRYGLSEYDSSQKLDSYLRELNSIVLTEFPTEFNHVLQIYRAIAMILATPFDETDRAALKAKSAELQPHLAAYFSLVGSLKSAYAQKLFGPANPARAVLDLRVDIRRDEVKFDQNFYDQMPDKETIPWSIDNDLSTCGRTIKVVQAEKDRSIPYAMESKAIRALGLQKSRPLINIAGGCRDADFAKDQIPPSILMGKQIMDVAHKYKINVAPPGTQSGFGADMAKVWLEYQESTDHLDSTEKANMFAVSPGGETWYPGNPLISKDPDREVYAINPMNSILTPFDAGWNWPGNRKADAPYFQHVEYMEAIYQRLAEGQPRVMVVGNGGLFTIVEANAALKNNVPIVLTENTGRFAELVIAVMRNFQNWDLLNDLEHNREALDREMLNIINTRIDGSHHKRLFKDFGAEVPTENKLHELFRVHFYEFLVLSRGQDLKISTIENLGNTIDEIIVRNQT